MQKKVFITVPPIDMEPVRGPFERKMVFQDPVSGSTLIGGRVTNATSAFEKSATTVHKLDEMRKQWYLTVSACTTGVCHSANEQPECHDYASLA